MLRASGFRFHEKGTTLVEIIVVVFIIVIFSSILVSNFPKILRQFALSRSVHKLSQDIRRVQDTGLSGVLITEQEAGGQKWQIKAKGYGIYFSLNQSTRYIIYVDRGDSPDSKYDGNPQLCSENIFPESDCIFEIIYITDEDPDLYIKEILNLSSGSANTSINFAPPNPDISIDGLSSGDKEIGVVLGLQSDTSAARTVWVNISGLIKVE